MSTQPRLKASRRIHLLGERTGEPAFLLVAAAANASLALRPASLTLGDAAALLAPGVARAAIGLSLLFWRRSRQR